MDKKISINVINAKEFLKNVTKHANSKEDLLQFATVWNAAEARQTSALVTVPVTNFFNATTIASPAMQTLTSTRTGFHSFVDIRYVSCTKKQS